MRLFGDSSAAFPRAGGVERLGVGARVPVGGGGAGASTVVASEVVAWEVEVGARLPLGGRAAGAATVVAPVIGHRGVSGPPASQPALAVYSSPENYSHLNRK